LSRVRVRAAEQAQRQLEQSARAAALAEREGR
jgi:hypothetical protein